MNIKIFWFWIGLCFGLPYSLTAADDSIRKDLFRPIPRISKTIEEPKRSSTNAPYRVQKIIFMEDHTRAIILNTLNDAIYYVKKGDSIEGWVVHSIDQEGVHLKQEDRMMDIAWDEKRNE